MIDLNHYNSYSSRKYSGNRRTIYLALDARGRPRRVAIPAQRALGKLSGYVRVMPRPAHRALHGCTKHRQASMTSAPPHPHHTKRPCRIPKKKRRCKEGERPVIDNCEKPPRRLQPQKCPPHKPDCAPARNATQPLHVRHKRPLKPKKPNKQEKQEKPERPEKTDTSQTPQNKKRPKKPPQKNKRKVGRAPEDIHGLSSLTTNSWEVEEEAWMSTSDEMLSSTQVEDVTSWELTTNSGFNREFFRGGSAVLETAEEDDT
ncbi:fibroblast growth factor branchless [Arctopsyche grandis]|uniref:fibroblast growth factor branchless n=1 Tax=Arctopsyche grandis TaxID=121162 RepID=UPI00406D8B5D